MIPIIKNIFVINEEETLLESTYVKRAKQLVKKGRAKWLSEDTIKLTLFKPNYEEVVLMSDNTKTEFTNIDFIKELIDKLANENQVATKAIEELSKLENQDLKAPKIVDVSSGHNQTKLSIVAELVKHLS